MPIDDSVVIAEGATGAIIATDLVTSGSTTANYQYVKMTWGPDGTVNPVTESGTSGPIPTQLYSNGTQITNTSGRLNIHLLGSGITLGITGDVASSVTGDVAVSGTVGITFGAGVTFDVSGSNNIGVTGNVAVSGTAGITFADGVTFDVSGSNNIGVTGNVAVSGTGLGVTGNVAVSGTGLGVTGNVAVSATDLDIRGLTMGLLGNTLGLATTTDSVVVQGVSGGFPANIAVYGYSAGSSYGTAIGASGDALKVSLADANISATVNVGTEVGVKSNNTFLQVSGSSAGSSKPYPISIEGTGGGTPVGITFANGVTFDVTNSTIKAITDTVTVSGTDLDIRGLSGGTWGTTHGIASNQDSIVVQGASGGYPVNTMLSGVSSSGEILELEVEFVGNSPILKTVIDSRGITNATAIQIQGRNDGSTLDPVYIAGVGATSAVSPIEGLLGVTFDMHSLGIKVQSGLTAPGNRGLAGASASVIATLLHGASGSSILPIGMTGDAINVNMVNADGVSFEVTVDSNFTITNPHTDAIPIQGCTKDAIGVFVTGTAGSTFPFPIMVQGYTTGSGTDPQLAPIGVTGQVFTEIITGATGSLLNIYAGLTGLSAAVHELSDDIIAIHNQATFVNIDSQIGDIESRTDTIDSNLASVINPTQSNPSKRVYVEVPTPTTIQQDSLTATGTVTSFSNVQLLKSGARFKLHPGADQVVFIGTQGTDTSKFYPLSAGDDIFIEINQISKISVFAPTAGTNLTVFALGF